MVEVQIGSDFVKAMAKRVHDGTRVEASRCPVDECMERRHVVTSYADFDSTRFELREPKSESNKESKRGSRVSICQCQRSGSSCT